MKIFLTGATGYLGAVVAEKLKRRGYKVSGLVRKAESADALAERGIEVVVGDLSDFDVLHQAAMQADAVIHTAFSHNFDDYEDAAKLDREVVRTFGEALAGTDKPLIITSTSAFLLDTRTLEADEDFPFDQDSNRLTRGETERDIQQLSQKGIRAIALRMPLFIYGRSGSSFVPLMIRQAKEAGSANYVGTGEHIVSTIHVEDAAEFYVAALETSTVKGVFNVATESVTLKDLNEAIARLLNVETRSITEEKGREQFGKMFEFLSRNNQLSSEKALQRFEISIQPFTTILDDIENGSYRRFLE